MAGLHVSLSEFFHLTRNPINSSISWATDVHATRFPTSLPSPTHSPTTQTTPSDPEVLSAGMKANGRHTVLICDVICLFEPRPSSDKYETAMHFQLDTHCSATSHRLQQQQHVTLLSNYVSISTQPRVIRKTHQSHQ